MPKSTSHKKEDEFDDEETEVKTKGSKKSKTKKVKGPSSAYNIYVAEHRAAISAENPGLSFGELSKRVSADWKQLSEDQRKVRYVYALVATTYKHTRAQHTVTHTSPAAFPTCSSSLFSPVLVPLLI
jgi:hypothetical protein